MMRKLLGSWITWCVLIMVLMGGCWINPFRFGSPRAPKKSKKYHRWHEKTTSKPKIVVTDKRGKVVVVKEEIKELDVTYKDEQEEARLTWWQRMCAWFGNLGTFGVVILIAALVLCPGATVGFLIRWARRSAGALRQVVKAVKEADVVAAPDEKLHDALHSNLTRTSKELVGKIKAQL